MNAVRVFTLAQNAFRETIRDRVLFILLFFIILLLAGNALLPILSSMQGYKIIPDISLTAIHLFSLVIAVFVGTNLLNKEIEKRTIFTLISKPVSRGELLVGKHLGLAGVLGVLMALMTLSFLLIYGSGHGLSLPLGNIFVALLFSYLELLLLVAAALLFGSFTSPILAAVFTLSLYLMGHFSQSLLQLGMIAKNEAIQNLTRVLYVMLPDLERFNLRDQAVYGLLPATGELWGTFIYGVGYTVFLLTGAYLLFARREF